FINDAVDIRLRAVQQMAKWSSASPTFGGNRTTTRETLEGVDCSLESVVQVSRGNRFGSVDLLIKIVKVALGSSVQINEVCHASGGSVRTRPEPDACGLWLHRRDP